MSQSAELNLEQIKLSLQDYQSELDAIDLETDREKQRILEAIQAEEAEIKSLLDRYRDIKRQKELEGVQSSYDNLSTFKQTLLSKIKLETQDKNLPPAIEPADGDAFENQHNAIVEGDLPKKTEDRFDESRLVNQKVKVIELIQFLEGMNGRDVAKMYPADVSDLVPNFELNNTVVRDELLKYYQKNNVGVYNALLKLYQKPELDPATIEIPNPETLPLRDRGYHSFLAENYPKSLPFFWYLINREPDIIRYVVMEFAVDHIIQTNTLKDDPDRQELNLKLTELLGMNETGSMRNFLKEIFLCFHPHRVNPNSKSKNKYFDYVTDLIRTQSTLEYSEILQLWNYMLQSGYEKVADPNFSMILHTDGLENGNMDLVSGGGEDLL